MGLPDPSARARHDDLTRRRRTAARVQDRRRRGVVAAFGSLALHGLVWAVLTAMPAPPPPPDRVLQVSFVARGSNDGALTSEPAAQPTPSPTPTPPSDRPAPAVPAPRGAPVPVPAPLAPGGRFAAISKANQGRPEMRDGTGRFQDWQQARMSGHLPAVIDDPGGRVDGDAAITTRGKDRCVPTDGRRVDGLYLLFDTSGSMSDTLAAQAMSCAQQYAGAVLDAGGTVVVGTFATSARFAPPTRSATDVALALRDVTDPRSTMLPSRELGVFFDANRPRNTDLVILSDGRIPNLREALPWYQYFMDLDTENRGYLYTLGVPGDPGVTSALRDIGFEVYVYKIL